MKKIFYFVLAAMALVSCGKNKNANLEQEKPQVKVVNVSMQPVQQYETYTATVESDVKNSISPNAPYRIKKIHVDVGDIVKVGQSLVQLDVTSQDQLNIQLQSQISAVESQKAQLQLAESEFKRIEELYHIGGVSKSDYETAKTQFTVQKTLLRQNQNQINVIKSQLAQMRQNTTLTAPISGVVTARNYDDGDMFTSLPILTIEKLNPIKMKINVSESYFSKIKKGMDVNIILDAYQDEIFKGMVSVVYPSIDNNTHTFPVEITIDNINGKVRPGMFGRAKLIMGTVDRCIIPDIALVKQVGAGDRYVYTYKDGKVYYKKVELGQHLGNKYEIISGVKPGDVVVTAGQAHLADAREVEVIK